MDDERRDTVETDETVISDGSRGSRRPADQLHHPRYEERGEVASGGMGSIREVFDRRMGRIVAVKLLHASLAERGPEKDEFLHEGRLTGQLDHPGIVPVHDISGDDETAHLVMKLVRGATLADVIHGRARAETLELGLEQMIDVLIKVCEGVAFAHSRNVLHLDLKPDNVMVGSFGQVYVMDWGIAAECTRGADGRLHPNNPRRSIRGTVAYMPPEQAGDSFDVDERSDVYGLGGIFYEMLTGQRPFRGKGTSADLLELCKHVVPHPSEVAGDRPLPPGLCEITMRALHRDPDRRHPDVESLKSDLEAFRRGGGWFDTRFFATGDVIVREGEPANAAYIITAGRCQAFQNRDGEKVMLREMGAGDVFGETAVLASGLRTASVEATETLTALVVTRESLERELEARGWLGVMVRALAARFRDVDAERARLHSLIGKTPA